MVRYVFRSSTILAVDDGREVLARIHFPNELPRFPFGEKP